MSLESVQEESIALVKDNEQSNRQVGKEHDE
jgi:hypothetical protein